MFVSLSSYMEDMQLSWKSCTGFWVDSASSVMVAVTGSKQHNLNTIFSHCFLHREVIESKTLGLDFNTLLSQALTR